MADATPDPVFDQGMTAHANRLAQSSNPHAAGTASHAMWERGWLAGEARGEQVEAEGTLL